MNTPVLALIGLLVASPLFAGEQTATFSIPGMYCASCPFIIESAMGDVDGVISVTANSDTRTALVTYDDEVASVADIADASFFAGYEAILLKGDS